MTPASNAAAGDDVAGLVARLERERDDAVERYAAAVADAARLRADVERKQALIHRYMNEDVYTRAARAEARLAASDAEPARAVGAAYEDAARIASLFGKGRDGMRASSAIQAAILDRARTAPAGDA